MIQNEDLHECPFCGGKAIMESWEMTPYEKMYIDSDGKWYSVFCSICLSCSGNYTTAAEAAAAWNRRTKTNDAKTEK